MGSMGCKGRFTRSPRSDGRGGLAQARWVASPDLLGSPGLPNPLSLVGPPDLLGSLSSSRHFVVVYTFRVVIYIIQEHIEARLAFHSRRLVESFGRSSTSPSSVVRDDGEFLGGRDVRFCVASASVEFNFFLGGS
ncbi:hypothetical protein CRG98_005306 [Punica granatum]|uniref:Uncharacterized protein n=1 Tax=Punica granatum TaxID=22663 RepID=A0A2I0L0Q1_PUNGR|nr:hypothetical protein CRG98_005306 [Punica granatum]